MKYSLEIQNLTKKYPGFTLDGVDFSIPNGTIMGLIGANGAGKSTTISACLGLIHKDSGTVRFWGEELTEAAKEDIGVVFDSLHFYEPLTVVQTGKICKAAYQNWDDALFARYLKEFGLSEKKQIKELSKGMKMKLSIALALAHKPKLLILDEATSGLDPVVRDDILEVFLDFVQDESHSILMSSHITSDLEKVADYITFLHDGKLIFTLKKDTLRYEYGIIRCTEVELGTIVPSEILAKRREATQWSVLVADKEAAKRKYKNLVVDDATIDEVMLIYVKGEQNR